MLLLSLVKKFFLFILSFYFSLSFSEDLECQREFTLISNQSSNEEIVRERQKNATEEMNWIVQAVQYIENPTPQENPLRNIKMAMIERGDGSMGYGINYPGGYSTVTARLIGDYHKILEMIVETISSLSQEHSRVKHGLWSHIAKITGQQNRNLFPSNIRNDILKVHFDSILDFLIDYLEHRNLQVAVNLSLTENRIRMQAKISEKVKKIRHLILQTYEN